jgi:hypothetical protein
MAPARDVPNPVDQRSPIEKQDRNVTVNTGDSDDVYNLARRNRVQINVISGEVEVKFFDADSNELTPSLIVDSNDDTWVYNWSLKQSAPSEVHIAPNGVENSEYDILIEKV